MRRDYLARILNAYLFRRRDSNLSFWHTPLATNVLKRDDQEGVRRYPMNFTDKTRYNHYRDAEGVIMLNYHGRIGVQYNPNAIAQQALGYYDRYLDHYDKDDKNAFIVQTNYFLASGREVDDGVLLWEYNFPFEMRNHLSSPWRSALAQSQAISVLIRAHQLTGDYRYIDAARKGYRAFRHLAREHEGGVLDDQDGYVWLEEYIIDSPNHVLNGFIWAMWGVRDYAIYFGDDHAHDLWKNCLNTLERHLHKYDLGFWTCYDWPQGWDVTLPVMPCSLYYQRLHAVQMEACYNLTGRSVFQEYHRKWKGYLESSWKKALSQVWKSYFKLRYF